MIRDTGNSHPWLHALTYTHTTIGHVAGEAHRPDFNLIIAIVALDRAAGGDPDYVVVSDHAAERRDAGCDFFSRRLVGSAVENAKPPGGQTFGLVLSHEEDDSRFKRN